jgi:hypothetical protein
VGFFWNFYSGERPLEGWVYILTIPLLGTRPLVWHIFILAMRWLTVLVMWWALRGLWPQRTRQITWMALLFAVYPAFEQQVFPINFSAHWITFTLYFASLGLMIRSLRASGLGAVQSVGRIGNLTLFGPLLWSLLALLLVVLHLWTLEYFAGLEFLRVFVIWIVVSESEPDLRKRLALTLHRWLPYLAVVAAFTVWRLFFLDVSSADPNEPALLNSLLVQPLSTSVRLLQFALQDFLNIVFSTWAKTVKPEVFDLTDRLVLFSVLLSLLVFALALFYLAKLKSSPPASAGRAAGRAWARQALVFGILAALLGPLPVWLTNRLTTWGLYGSRFALASIFGASILWVAFLEWSMPRRLPKLLLLSALIALSVGFHIRWTNAFRWIWKDELRFYWQLYWRAPYLKPGSTIASDGEFFPYVGRNATALAINLLYPQSDYPGIDYWFYEVHPGFVRDHEEMKAGKTISFNFRKFDFTGSTLDSVFVTYESEKGQCLWVLSPEDDDNPDINPMLAEALPISNLSRIERKPRGAPVGAIFGREPPHDWCYYFQKAGLARQFEDWEEVSHLGDEAQKLGFGPNNPQEWLPFIEGYARAGRWQDAVDTSLHVRRVNHFLSPRLCTLWGRILADAPPPATSRLLVDQMTSRLECGE